MVQKMRSEEHTSELQSRVDISYAVFCLKKKLGANALRKFFRRHVVSACNTSTAFLQCLFFFNDTATTEICTLSLHAALPICGVGGVVAGAVQVLQAGGSARVQHAPGGDWKGPRLNASHAWISRKPSSAS